MDPSPGPPPASEGHRLITLREQTFPPSGVPPLPGSSHWTYPRDAQGCLGCRDPRDEGCRWDSLGCKVLGPPTHSWDNLGLFVGCPSCCHQYYSPMVVSVHARTYISTVTYSCICMHANSLYWDHIQLRRSYHGWGRIGIPQTYSSFAHHATPLDQLAP